jgi:hypothetical protein
MKITFTKNEIRPLHPGDPDFMIYSGNIVAARAGFEISNNCPYNHLQILETCIERGWIKPIAYVKDHELFWEEFSK